MITITTVPENPNNTATDIVFDLIAAADYEWISLATIWPKTGLLRSEVVKILDQLVASNDIEEKFIVAGLQEMYRLKPIDENSFDNGSQQTLSAKQENKITTPELETGLSDIREIWEKDAIVILHKESLSSGCHVTIQEVDSYGQAYFQTMRYFTLGDVWHASQDYSGRDERRAWERLLECFA